MSHVIGLSQERVTIFIKGRPYIVQKDKLLYVFQDLEMLRATNKFCWNGDCKNCTITFKKNGQSREITERACQTAAAEGLIVTHMPKQFYLSHEKVNP